MKRFCAAAVAFAALIAPRAFALDLHDPQVAAFIDTMVREHHFQRAELDKILAPVVPDAAIIKSMEAPAEALPWFKYRAIFVTPARAAGGRAFVAAHAAALAAAERRYGVPPEVVTALIGMETYYGKYEGSHSALTALATLAFSYPRRATFFRRELADFLVLCRRNHFDPTALKGSYAGALGAGQFMPSSYLAYAVDADGGGADLFGDWSDVVASMANYLSRNGWRRGQPLAAPAGIPEGAEVSGLLDRSMPARSLHARGIVFDAPVAGTAPVRLIKVEMQKGDEYWVALPNFMALMAYNGSVDYALAATELAAAIASAAAPATAGGPLAAERP